MEKTSTQSRRSFLGKSAVAATAFTIVKPHLVRGAGSERLRAGLVGCGGRGTQAVTDLLAGNENVELVAMADVYEDKLETSLRNLREGVGGYRRYVGARVVRNGAWYTLTEEDVRKSVADGIQVDPEHHFVGPDAYRKLIDSELDIVMLCTPPGYRPMHFEAAVNAGKNIFCEKPFATDAVGARRFMAAARKSEERNLTVITGAQRRYQRDYMETVDKIRDGAIGDIVATYAYWIGTPVIQQQRRDPSWSDSEFQHRAWYSFCWICGDQIVEQHLHNIDVSNWVMGMHPIRARAVGGAAWRPREEIYGNIFDHVAAEFVYPNGVILTSYCRQYPRGPGMYENVSERVVGTEGVSNCHDMGEEGNNPYMQEHIALVNSIRQQGPRINSAMEVAESTMTCIMGREAAYSGREITWTDMMLSQQDLFPKDLGPDAKIPVPPLPVPGKYEFV